jgi:PhzF family phenazine biosynthesis protein
MRVVKDKMGGWANILYKNTVSFSGPLDKSTWQNMHTHAFNVFGAHPGAGNPALVITDGDPDAAVRQALARDRGVTCVFLDPPGAAVDARIDYWYPHARSPLCLHATLAASAVLFAHGGSGPLAVSTAMRGQRLDVLHDGAAYYVGMQPQAAPPPAMAPALLRQLLGAPGLTPPAPPRVASVGSPKLLVEVPDVATLYGLAPDLEGITAWGRTHGVNGLYVYCRVAPGLYEGRNFNHLEAHLEDSATGVAAGALTALLGHGLDLRQGRATGRDCLIRTRIDGDAILVGGRVEPAAW